MLALVEVALIIFQTSCTLSRVSVLLAAAAVVVVVVEVVILPVLCPIFGLFLH